MWRNDEIYEEASFLLLVDGKLVLSGKKAVAHAADEQGRGGYESVMMV
jgi:hypothetical protein